MRERTTWDRNKIKEAAMSRRADPYTMNQDHISPQPSADEYVIGGPSEFAEDVNKDNRWEDEYSGGQVKRNEIGEPEMRAETFNHPEKTAAMEANMLKKANICVKVARRMLPKTASETLIEDQAVALMDMADYDLFETYTRLAGDIDPETAKTAQDDEDQGDESQGDESQDKEAGQMPPQFKENAEEKKEDEGEKKEAQQQAQVSQQDLQAMIAQAIQQQAQQEQQAQQQVQEQVQEQDVIEQQAQQQQPVAQQDIQAMIAEMVQQQMAQMQQQACGEPMAQQQAPVQAEEEVVLDAPVDEMGIEMQAPVMDTGDVVLGPEDDVLQTLFASDEAEEAQEAQEAQEAEEGQKQANVRTASTRTVGTKPSAGVSRIGGKPASQGSNDVDRLSGIWQSAPDVREAFGLPNK